MSAKRLCVDTMPSIPSAVAQIHGLLQDDGDDSRDPIFVDESNSVSTSTTKSPETTTTPPLFLYQSQTKSSPPRRSPLLSSRKYPSPPAEKSKKRRSGEGSDKKSPRLKAALGPSAMSSSSSQLGMSPVNGSSVMSPSAMSSSSSQLGLSPLNGSSVTTVAALDELLGRLGNTQDKLTRAMDDLSGEKTVGKRKDKNLAKLAKYLQKKSKEVQRKEEQIVKLMEMLGNMGKKLKLSNEEIQKNEREIRELREQLATSVMQNESETRELQKKLMEASQDIERLQTKLKSSEQMNLESATWWIELVDTEKESVKSHYEIPSRRVKLASLTNESLDEIRSIRCDLSRAQDKTSVATAEAEAANLRQKLADVEKKSKKEIQALRNSLAKVQGEVAGGKTSTTTIAGDSDDEDSDAEVTRLWTRLEAVEKQSKEEIQALRTDLSKARKEVAFANKSAAKVKEKASAETTRLRVQLAVIAQGYQQEDAAKSTAEIADAASAEAASLRSKLVAVETESQEEIRAAAEEASAEVARLRTRLADMEKESEDGIQSRRTSLPEDADRLFAAASAEEANVKLARLRTKLSTTEKQSEHEIRTLRNKLSKQQNEQSTTPSYSVRERDASGAFGIFPDAETESLENTDISYSDTSSEPDEDSDVPLTKQSRSSSDMSARISRELTSVNISSYASVSSAVSTSSSGSWKRRSERVIILAAFAVILFAVGVRFLLA